MPNVRGGARNWFGGGAEMGGGAPNELGGAKHVGGGCAKWVGGGLKDKQMLFARSYCQEPACYNLNPYNSRATGPQPYSHGPKINGDFLVLIDQGAWLQNRLARLGAFSFHPSLS